MSSLRLVFHDFRHGQEIVEHREAWSELRGVAESIEDDEIVSTHRSFEQARGRLPAGGQSAINEIFRRRLVPLGWIPEPSLFASGVEGLRRWKMDFLKESIGVEVSFNHAEAVPWTFTRLNIAGESTQVVHEHRIDAGVAFYATDRLKVWAKMDNAVGTFELACVWLEMMRPIMPVPILVVGLDADGWEATDVFRGTRSARGPARAQSASLDLGDEDGSDPLDDTDY